MRTGLSIPYVGITAGLALGLIFFCKEEKLENDHCLGFVL